MKGIFGWIVSGRASLLTGTVKRPRGTLLQIASDPDPAENQELLQAFQKYWELEHLGIKNDEPARPEFVTQYLESIERDEQSGRYRVKLPWITDTKELVTLHNMAKSRLEGLVLKLRKKPEMLELYHGIIRKFLLYHSPSLLLHELND